MNGRMRTGFLVALALAACAAAAEAPAFLEKGGWEFGGNGMLSFIPWSEDMVTDHQMSVDASAKAAIFLADRFSLGIRPSLFFYESKLGTDTTDAELSRVLLFGLGLEPTYFLSLGRSFILGLGAELGVGLEPGLPERSGSTTRDNDFLFLNAWAEPRIGAYYLLSGGLALYACAGMRIAYFPVLSDPDGLFATEMEDPVTLMRGRFSLSVGLSYFLPKGARGAEAPRQTGMIDWESSSIAEAMN